MALSRSARMFFALWPVDSVRDALRRESQMLQGGCGGRTMRRGNIHLTLVFIGDVARERIDELKALGQGVCAASFAIVLDQVGYWKHNRIVWAAPRASPGPLLALVAGIEGALERAGFDFDKRPYAPHITLICNAREPHALFVCDLRWPMSEFRLVESVRDDRGSRYRVAASCPLAPPFTGAEFRG